MSLVSEIKEQPAVLQKQLSGQKEIVLGIAEKIKKYNPSLISMVARGTSDHACDYGKYLLGTVNHIACSLACPSMATFYKSNPILKQALTIAVSQSGKSPDLIAETNEAKKQGSPVLVITNTPDSPLGETADYVIDCMAGPEKATAATKSYTTSLMAYAMLSAALKDDDAMWKELERVPEWADEALAKEEEAHEAAKRYIYATHCVVLGRGLNYCSAKEWGLKLQELTYMMAESYSSADFQHGPIAMIDHHFPVLAIAPEGKVIPSMLPQMENIRKNLFGDLFSITNNDAVANLSSHSIRIAKDVPEWLSPIIAIIPAQLFAYHLCNERGYDTEHSRTISKVTETK